MKRNLIALLTILISLVFSAATAGAVSQYGGGSTGYDVSYPNCRANVGSAAFGIVGVNGGLPYTENPCLFNQALLFKNLSYYVNTAWNDQSASNDLTSPKACEAADLNCAAYNYGYAAGLQSVNYVRDNGLPTKTAWWLDVETMNTWSSDVIQNQNSLQGEYDALIASGATSVGIYSTTFQWTSITGGWKNMWPSWGATTWRTAREAASYCRGHEFTGGRSMLMQYIGQKFDENVAC